MPWTSHGRPYVTERIFSIFSFLLNRASLFAPLFTALRTSNAVHNSVKYSLDRVDPVARAGAPRKAVQSRQELEQLGRQKRRTHASRPTLSAAYVPQKAGGPVASQQTEDEHT